MGKEKCEMVKDKDKLPASPAPIPVPTPFVIPSLLVRFWFECMETNKRQGKGEWKKRPSLPANRTGNAAA